MLILLMAFVFIASNVHMVYHHGALLENRAIVLTPKTPGDHSRKPRAFLRRGEVSSIAEEVSIRSPDEGLLNAAYATRLTEEHKPDVVSAGFEEAAFTLQDNDPIDRELNDFRERFRREINPPTPAEPFAFANRVETEVSLVATAEMAAIAESPTTTPTSMATGFIARRLGLASIPRVEGLRRMARTRVSKISALFDQDEEVEEVVASGSTMLKSLENALRHGASGGIANVVYAASSKQQWSTVKDIANGSTTALWLGCIMQPEALALPFELARKTPEMTVIAAHACGSDNMTVTGTLPLSNAPPNLLVARGIKSRSTHAFDDDEVAQLPAAWHAAAEETSVDAFYKGGCDWLLVSEEALACLTNSLLPSIAEEILARALLWCDSAVLPADIDVGGYWAYAGRSTGLVHAALARLPDEVALKIEMLPAADRTAPYLLRVVRTNPMQRCQAVAFDAIRTLEVAPRDALRVLSYALERRGTDSVRSSEALACAFSIGDNDSGGALGFRAGQLEPLITCDLDARRKRQAAYYISRPLHAKGPRRVHKKKFEANDFIENFSFTSTTYLASRSRESSPAEIFAQLASEETYALRWWWSSVKDVLKPLNAMHIGIIFIGNDLGMVAVKAARFTPLAIVINWRSDRVEYVAAVRDLSKLLASQRVVVGNSPTTLTRLRSLNKSGGPGVVAVSASTIVTWLAASSGTACDVVMLEARLGAAIEMAQYAVLIEFPRLCMLTVGLHDLAPSCATAIEAAYAGDEVALLLGALERTIRQASQINVSIGVSSVPEWDGLIPAEAHILFRVNLEVLNGTVSASRSLSLASALIVGLSSWAKAALLRAHLRLPLDRIHLSLFSEMPDLLSPERLSLTVLDGAPALMIYEGVSSLLWPTTTVEPEPWIATRGAEAWNEIKRELHASPAEHRSGHFSLIEFGCRDYSVALEAAAAFPNATVLSVAGLSTLLGDTLYEAASMAKLHNVICCAGEPLDGALATKFYESPELARFVLLQSPSLLAGLSGDYGEFKLSTSRLDQKRALGRFISLALTTWLPFPSIKHVSLAMLALFPEAVPASVHEKKATFLIDAHPKLAFSQILREAIERHALIPGDGKTRISNRGVLSAPGRPFPFPLMRLDVVEMTRKVHHHFDWAKDGHQRTYTMCIDVNESFVVPRIGITLIPGSWHDSASGGGAVVWHESGGARVRLSLPFGHHISNGRVLHVRLTRDQDAGYIPYGVIRAFTLICAFRLGLVNAQTEKVYGDFVKLPLYEDMAPWNIALAAGSVEYIDYDTRGKVYDDHVKETYRVLSVLMNYKRTVSDFGKCGESAHNPYGFGQVSSCVKPQTFDGACDESDVPVPCDDGKCHSDYISCLRALDIKHHKSHDIQNQNSETVLKSPANLFYLHQGY